MFKLTKLADRLKLSWNVLGLLYLFVFLVTELATLITI